MLEMVLRGVLPPIVAALLLVSLLGMRALPLAAGVGLYAAHGLLKRAWPPWPHELLVETDGVAWLVWGVVATGVLAACERFGALPRRIVWFGAPALAGAMIWLSLGKLIARWPASEVALHAGTAVVVVAATSMAMRRALQRLDTSIWPVAMWTAVLSIDAMLATFGKSALLGQLCGAVAAALGAAGGARLWRRQPVLAPADAGWLAAAHAGFVLVTVHLAYLPWGPAICALSAPFVLLLLLPRAIGAGTRANLAAALLLLTPMAIALWWAWPAADPYGY